MKPNDLNKITNDFKGTDKMPLLFLGHGNPMNAIEDNEFVRGFKKVTNEFKRPTAIIVISAHWETRGTFVTAMEMPRTIHDFSGFPKELYEVKYPAPGNPMLAEETKSLIESTEVKLDDKWGLDHGAWSVVKHMYPNADIPVIELSLDYQQSPQFHYELAKELKPFRSKGVLIIGSGNMVHNLRIVDWRRLGEINYGHDWTFEASEKMKKFILSGDHKQLINYTSQGKEFNLAIPTPEHFLPLLYVLALKETNEEVSIFNDKAVGGSLTMTSVKIETQ